MQDSCRWRALCRAASALAVLCCSLPGFAQEMHTHGHPAATESARPAPAAGADTSFAARMDVAMATMNADMARAPMTGDPDHDFAAMMVPHHQGAVEMAKAELLYGKNPVLRRLAQEIIVTQGSEIAVMRSELQSERNATSKHTP